MEPEGERPWGQGVEGEEEEESEESEQLRVLAGGQTSEDVARRS